MKSFRKPLKRSYIIARPQQISEKGPAIGRCDGRPIYEWVRLRQNPTVKYEFAGLAPKPVPATLFEPGKTILALVVEPGLAYEPAR
jgi:hypothetical protein